MAEQSEELFEDAPCGLLTTEPDGLIRRVNRTFEQLTGHRRADLVGIRRFQDLLGAGGRIYHETHYAPLLRMQGTVRELALELVRADESRLSALVNSELASGPDGRPDHVRIAVFPAADRRRYERELLEARDREREAREQAERLGRMAAALAAAPGAEAVAEAVTAALVDGLGADVAELAIREERAGAMRILGRRGVGAAGELDDGAPGVHFRMPLQYGGRTRGVLSFAFAAGAPELSAHDRAFAEVCAAQAAVALDRALLYEHQREVAHALQRSLLAVDPPIDPRFDVATLYEPGVDALEVGGDWHDVFRLPDGRVAVVVGDVVGRGLEAASAMGQLRSAVRALAPAQEGPAAVLAALDTFVGQVPSARFATVAYAEVDPAAGDTRFARAGHLPPVLVEPGRAARLVMEGASPPVGVAPPAGRGETRLRIPAGGGVLLYTDGLVERRTESIDAGLNRLLEVVASRTALAPRQLVDSVRDAMLTPGHGDDDVCCLWFARGPAQAEGDEGDGRDGDGG